MSFTYDEHIGNFIGPGRLITGGGSVDLPAIWDTGLKESAIPTKYITRDKWQRCGGELTKEISGESIKPKYCGGGVMFNVLPAGVDPPGPEIAVACYVPVIETPDEVVVIGNDQWKVNFGLRIVEFGELTIFLRQPPPGGTTRRPIVPEPGLIDVPPVSLAPIPPLPDPGSDEPNPYEPRKARDNR